MKNVKLEKEEMETRKREELEYARQTNLKDVSDRFTPFHHRVSDNKNLTPMSRLVYLCIKHQINIRAPYTYSELKNKFNLNNDVIKKALVDCETHGLWTLSKVKSCKNGAYKERLVINLTDFKLKYYEKIPNALLITDNIKNKTKAFLVCRWKHIVDYNKIMYDRKELTTIMQDNGFGIKYIKASLEELFELKIFRFVDGGDIEIHLASFIEISNNVIKDMDRELRWYKNESKKWYDKYSETKRRLNEYDPVEEVDPKYELDQNDISQLKNFKVKGYHPYDVHFETGIDFETIEFHWERI